MRKLPSENLRTFSSSPGIHAAGHWRFPFNPDDIGLSANEMDSAIPGEGLEGVATVLPAAELDDISDGDFIGLESLGKPHFTALVLFWMVVTARIVARSGGADNPSKWLRLVDDLEDLRELRVERLDDEVIGEDSEGSVDLSGRMELLD